MGGRLTILWGIGEGPCPSIGIKSTLLWCLRVSGDPDIGGQVELVIFIGFKCTVELLANFPRPFG